LAGFPQVDFVNLGFKAANRYSRIVREQLQLPPLVKKAGVDVLWSPGYTAPFFSVCPQVVTIHDMQYKSHPQDMTLLARFTTDMLVRNAARQCRRIIAVSEFSKKEIVRFTAAKSEAIDVIHEAADASFGERVDDAARRKILQGAGIADKPYILCVSNTYPHKNIHGLVKGFGELLAGIPHRLVIIGRPRFGEPAVRSAIEDLGDRSRVSRIEYVRFQNLAAIYQAADLFVFPSLYEGFGLPVLEAMMAGVPVVANRVASIPELGGDCVHYADSADGHGLASGMKKALAMNPAQRDDWCEKAKMRARSFSWQATADRTIECFKRATAAQG
jgi:glycosyltransferase involved in cell wall biosynthesis